MIASCTQCQARYQLEDDKVPNRVIKVRCPACQGVFTLDGTLREDVALDTGFETGFDTSAAPPSVATPTFSSEAAPASEPAASVDPVSPFAETSASDPFAAGSDPAPVAEADPLVEATPAFQDTPADSFAEPDPEPVAPAAESASESKPVGVATLDESAPTGGRRRRCKEEMLARALVSDILVYNRETRDTALAEGNLLEVLGGEIKKSWELYKEKVTPEVANSTTYFREALNEILADGQSVF